jgi:transcriptional regulator with XRE-family HTH domain
MSKHTTLPEVKLFREKIGAQIAEIQEIRQISTEELAERSGLQKYSLETIKRGNFPVNIDELRQISVVLDFDLVLQLR